MAECPKEGWWIFKNTIHDWDEWKKVDERIDDVSTVTRISYKYSTILMRKCKNCGFIETTTRNSYT